MQWRGRYSRLVLDVFEQSERLPVEQEQELGQVCAPQGEAGLQHEHLGNRRLVSLESSHMLDHIVWGGE